MDKKYKYLIVVLLIVSSLFAFGRIAGNDFINFDDPRYITENPHVKSGINLQTIKWAFSTPYAGNWHPLTLLSHTLDWSLFGANAFGHHLINLLLHIGSALFLFFLLTKMTKNLWTSAFVAAFVALHPLRVESVAWAAERKDVLSMFFGMASIYAYVFYTDKSKFSYYFLCLILFALSLMSKPMLVTLPFILLLLDYWPLGRWQKTLSAPTEIRYKIVGRLAWEKAPFFLLTIASSIATIWAQNQFGAFTLMEHLSFPIRVTNAFISYVSYLVNIFWPVDLAVFYPYKFSMPLWELLISALIITVITAFVFYYIKKLPFLFVGWLWYLGTLIPVIGLVQVGFQAMADRYTYLPSIGIAIMLAWGMPLLFQRLEIRKKILFSVALAVLCMLAVLTWMQCGYWNNSMTLFAHTLQVTKDNYLAHYNLGCSLFDEGKIEEAIDNYNKAINIKPDYIGAYNNRAVAYHKLGHYQRAIEDYNQTIRLKPDNDLAYYNIGLSYIGLGQYQLAINNFNEAIRLNPNYARAYNNRGISYNELGQYQLAIDDFNKAISIIPYYVKAYNKRGNAYLSQGNKKLGCNDAQKACELGDCKLLEEANSKGTFCGQSSIDTQNPSSYTPATKEKLLSIQ
jgi:tetratricopeptide (TPR) repeat protein